MHIYDEKQMSEANRRFNDIESCIIVGIDEKRGVRYKPVWGNIEDWIRPRDFEVESYRIGDWIDMIFSTVTTQGHTSIKSARFIGKTPKRFIPKK